MAWILAHSQVSNNNIHSRSELVLNELIRSSTNNNTVEWDCINKELTKKCLVYHNDQWFYFTPPDNGTYYINIASQQCKKQFGIQLIVIEGNPCVVKDYTIKRCISKIHQDDVFVRLDSLKANSQYLINVDGFLEDFCEFEISFSDRPNGLPEIPGSKHVLELKTETKDKLVTLTWRADLAGADRIEQFEVYRSKTDDRRSVLVNKQVVRRNALGLFEEYYRYTDTLQHDGVYQYTILMEEKGTHNRTLLDQTEVKHVLLKFYRGEIPLKFSAPGLLTIEIIDADRKQTVTLFTHDYQQPERMPLDFSLSARREAKRFWVKVKHAQEKQAKLFAFEAQEGGSMRLIGQ